MIERIEEKPAVFKTTETGDHYYKVYDDLGTYAYMVLNFSYPPYAILHLEVARWSHNTLKSMAKSDWMRCQMICLANDCNSIVASKRGTLADNPKYLKLLKHFGFPEPVEQITTIKEIKVGSTV